MKQRFNFINEATILNEIKLKHCLPVKNVAFEKRFPDFFAFIFSSVSYFWDLILIVRIEECIPPIVKH